MPSATQPEWPKSSLGWGDVSPKDDERLAHAGTGRLRPGPGRLWALWQRQRAGPRRAASPGCGRTPQWGDLRGPFQGHEGSRRAPAETRRRPGDPLARESVGPGRSAQRGARASRAWRCGGRGAARAVAGPRGRHPAAAWRPSPATARPSRRACKTQPRPTPRRRGSCGQPALLRDRRLRRGRTLGGRPFPRPHPPGGQGKERGRLPRGDGDERALRGGEALRVQGRRSRLGRGAHGAR